MLFGQPGQLELQHRTPGRTYRLAAITVTVGQAEPPPPGQFAVLRQASELAAERRALDAWAGRSAGQDAGLDRRDG